jgi:hypothetical protein
MLPFKSVFKIPVNLNWLATLYLKFLASFSCRSRRLEDNNPCGFCFVFYLIVVVFKFNCPLDSPRELLKIPVYRFHLSGQGRKWFTIRMVYRLHCLDLVTAA